MGERKTKQELEVLKKKYDVDILWSWSRYNTYCTDPFGYYLKYIKHEPETRTSIFGVSGNNVHEILERYYNKEVTYEDMIDEYENKLFEMNMAELKYNRKDEEANEKIANKYEDCIRLFFKEYVPEKSNVVTEQFIVIKIGKYIFQGYLDIIHKDKDNNYIITDFKTSTIYVGKKVDKEKGQLVLYAEGLVQLGVPIDKIKIRWNFLKYCIITYQLKGIDKETKLHKTKTTKALRNEWVNKIKGNLKMWLTQSEQYDESQIEEMVNMAIENNNLNNIPKDIQAKYQKNNCYVYIPLDKNVINELKDKINNTLNEIIEKKERYEKTQDDKLWWTEINEQNEFFFANLSGYSAKQHKPYNEYLEKKELFKNNYKDEVEDLSWMDQL